MNLNLLVSYAHMRKSPEPWLEFFDAVKGRFPLMIDSGAYTAWSVGDPIDHTDYIGFLLANEHRFDHYVQLDIVRDAAATAVNLQTELEAGLRPMGVLTLDMAEDRFAALAEANDRVCIAGGVDESSDYYISRIERCWRSVRGACRIHGLGYTRAVEPFKSKVASIDSSTWAVGARYGKFSLFYRTRGCIQYDFRKMKRTPFVRMPRSVQNYLIASGIRCDEFQEAGVASTNLSLLQLVTTDAWFRFAEACEDRGVEFYFALLNLPSLVPLALVSHHRVAGGLNWPALKQARQLVLELFNRDRAAFYQYLIDGIERGRHAA